MHGRAGREGKDGKVIIQTYNPENFCIQHARKQNYEMFYKTEIALRKQLKYPPFCDIILFNVSSKDKEKIEFAAKELHKLLQKNIIKYKVNLELFNPVASPISKIKNNYRWRIIAKCKLSRQILEFVNKTLEEYYGLKIKNVRVIVDSNPNNMN